LPRWIRIKQIKKRETRIISELKIAVKIPTTVVLCSHPGENPPKRARRADGGAGAERSNRIRLCPGP
jgi:hypothetical protein